MKFISLAVASLCWTRIKCSFESNPRKPSGAWYSDADVESDGLDHHWGSENSEPDHSDMLDLFMKRRGRTVDVMDEEYDNVESHPRATNRYYGQQNRNRPEYSEYDCQSYQRHNNMRHVNENRYEQHEHNVEDHYDVNSHRRAPEKDIRRKPIDRQAPEGFDFEENPRAISLLNNEDYRDMNLKTNKQKRKGLRQQSKNLVNKERKLKQNRDSSRLDSSGRREHTAPSAVTAYTRVDLNQFANKEQIFAHFSLRFQSDEDHGVRTPRPSTTRPPEQASTTLLTFTVSEETVVTPSTQTIGILRYKSGEDLFEYYLRNISQGRTGEDGTTRKRIRFSRTTPIDKGLDLYDSVTSCPGYFDESLKRLVDSYVDSRVTNTSEVMRIRARDAQWLKEAEERDERGESAPSSGFDLSVWRYGPIKTSMTPRARTTPTTPTTKIAEDEMYDYVIRNKKRRRVNPAEPILRTLITKEPYEMFERLFGTKITKVLSYTLT